jgi:hypothetical protein
MIAEIKFSAIVQDSSNSIIADMTISAIIQPLCYDGLADIGVPVMV